VRESTKKLDREIAVVIVDARNNKPSASKL